MTRPGERWQNWGRSASSVPQRIEYPRTIDAVQRAVKAAGRRGMPVKAIGAGHSFTEIAVAPGLLLELRDLSGLVAVDVERSRVTLLAGTRLHRIPALLAPYGLAMQNLGDIDHQSISGAGSTGTHGTGARFGGIATQVQGARLITAVGELLTVSDDENPELLPAVALGLGALGILVEVTLQCVPAFVLHAVERREPLADVVEDLDRRTADEDHFEFYWFPGTDFAMTKTNTRLPESAPRRPLSRIGRFVDDELICNGLYGAVCAVASVAPAILPPLTPLLKLAGEREYTDVSPRVFTAHRGVRFREMEYAVPAENLRPAFEAVRELIDARRSRISFPLEVRIAAADDLWMSTAHGRATGYVAFHRYWRENPTDYFRAMEEVMLSYGGRPHWGKIHTLDASTLRERYPRFDEFTALRDRLDPERMFRNAYLDRVLGA